MCEVQHSASHYQLEMSENECIVGGGGEREREREREREFERHERGVCVVSRHARVIV